MAEVWDAALDEIERVLDLVEDALEADEPIPTLPPFEPPADVMPPMSHGQQRRAEALMRRQAVVTSMVSGRVVTAKLELGETRRRRRAAVAYVRGA